ncbi:hypothetical protein [Xenorhabdus bovienii]|uniref:hypothetical protein n=1 Tax=Xenorhabdus bovienii TaxID=40576 RepID=UPI003DA2D482
MGSERSQLTRRQWCAIAGGLMGGFMAILDIQIINSSMNVIQGALSAKQPFRSEFNYFNESLEIIMF